MKTMYEQIEFIIPTVEEYLQWFNISFEKRKIKLKYNYFLSEILCVPSYDFGVLHSYNSYMLNCFPSEHFKEKYSGCNNFACKYQLK